MSLPSEAQDRKDTPMARGLLDYFPDALAAVARLSQVANEQHNPGEPMHWAREKSQDHADCIIRHLVDRGTFDTDGQCHSTKVAWRALALLQLELEASPDRLPDRRETDPTDPDGSLVRTTMSRVPAPEDALPLYKAKDPAANTFAAAPHPYESACRDFCEPVS